MNTAGIVSATPTMPPRIASIITAPPERAGCLGRRQRRKSIAGHHGERAGPCRRVCGRRASLATRVCGVIRIALSTDGVIVDLGNVRPVLRTFNVFSGIIEYRLQILVELPTDPRDLRVKPLAIAGLHSGRSNGNCASPSGRQCSCQRSRMRSGRAFQARTGSAATRRARSTRPATEERTRAAR